jgi:hypothetical protein
VFALVVSPRACYPGRMDHRTTVLERAFALAKSGSCTSVPDIKKQLRREGYSVAQIVGKSLSKQLQTLLRAVDEKL